MWYLSFCDRSPGAVPVAQGDGPDPASHPPEDRVLRVHAVGEEEREVGGEVVDRHTPSQIGLHIGEPVGQGEGQLGDRVGSGFGDVVAGDRDGVEVAHPVPDEELLDVGHHPERELGREDAGVLALVLLEDVGLDRAPDGPQRPGPNANGLVRRRRAAVLGGEVVHLLVDGRVEEHGQDGRRRAVDGHRHRRGRVAEVEPVEEGFHVVQGGHRDTRGADLPVDVRSRVGVAAVEGHRVERRREAGGGLALGQQMEAPVRALRIAFAGEHPGRVLVVPFEGEDARGERKMTGQVLRSEPAEQVPFVAHPGQRHPGDPGARRGDPPERVHRARSVVRARRFVGGARLAEAGELVEQGPVGRIDPAGLLLGQARQKVAGGPGQSTGLLQQRPGRGQVLGPTHLLCPPGRLGVVAPDRGDHIGQVPDPVGGDDRGPAGRDGGRAPGSGSARPPSAHGATADPAGTDRGRSCPRR